MEGTAKLETLDYRLQTSINHRGYRERSGEVTERPVIGVAAALPHTTAASSLRYGSRAAGRFQA
jgi:hypothetical protein